MSILTDKKEYGGQMLPQHERLRLVIGDAALSKLRASRVIVFGVGGVGGYVVEALARSGIGSIDIVDNDKVDITNINRQIIALHSTVGRQKVDVCAERIKDIDPSITVNTHPVFYLPDTADELDLSSFDYIVDAVDTVSAKIEIALRGDKAGVPVISAMGAGNKTDPSKLVVTDIYKTDTDPLAKVMRKELRQRGVRSLKVVYSKEPVRRADLGPDENEKNRRVTGSTGFVPPAAGLLIASVVVSDLIGG